MRRTISTQWALGAMLSTATLAGPAATAADGAPAPSPVPPDVVRQILGEALAAPQGHAALAALTETIGPRLAGSASARKAEAWAAAEFRRRGAVKVQLEEFTIDGWERGKLSLDLVKPTARSIPAAAAGYSPGTGGPKEGPVVDAREATPALMATLKDRLKGAIVLMGPPNPDQSSPAPPGSAPAFAACEKAGALAVVLQWSRSTIKTSAREAFTKLPTVVVSREDGDLLRRAAAGPGGARLRIDMTGKVTKGVKVNNVVAEVRGREKPDEYVVVGAHLDSWDLARGAIDNGHGSAAVLEAARLIASVKPPRRTVRFVLFMAEEPGLLGSKAYVERHADELPRTVLMINDDSGPGDVAGVDLYLRGDARVAIDEIARAGVGLGLDHVVETQDEGSDSSPFLRAGVPAASVARRGFDYFSAHHTALDTIDKVPPDQLARLSAAIALLAYGAAERAEPPAPHLSPDAVKKLLKEP